MGFCFYNNVVLAALSLLGQGLERVLIFDWVNPDAVHGPQSLLRLALIIDKYEAS